MLNWWKHLVLVFWILGIYFVMLEMENNFCSRGLVKYFTAIFYCSFNIFCCIYCTTFDVSAICSSCSACKESKDELMGFLLSQLWFKDVKLWNNGKSCRTLSHGHYWDVLRLFHLISASIRKSVFLLNLLSVFAILDFNMESIMIVVGSLFPFTACFWKSWDMVSQWTIKTVVENLPSIPLINTDKKQSCPQPVLNAPHICAGQTSPLLSWHFIITIVYLYSTLVCLVCF